VLPAFEPGSKTCWSSCCRMGAPTHPKSGGSLEWAAERWRVRFQVKVPRSRRCWSSCGKSLPRAICGNKNCRFLK